MKSTQKSIRDFVLECLQEFAEDDDRIIDELKRLVGKHGKQTFPTILHVLTQLEFPQQEAENCWWEIVAQREALSASLGRKVSLRTAVCDYFCSVHKSLKNPKVVEIHIFEAASHSSRYDGLTGLLNRRSFDEALIQEVTRSKRYETGFSVLFFDLDNFKRLNDSMGHLAGDAALKAVAEIITEEKRTEDVAARYGGEEMILILPESGKVQALVLGERIRERVEAMRLNFEGKTVRLTLSGGLVSFPIDAQEPEKLLECSDKAMYCAKGSGKNTIALYSQNKRRYLRIDFAGEIQVQSLQPTALENLSAQGKDISLAGVLFENGFPLDMSSKIKLNIPIAEGREALHLIGTVVRVEQLGKDKYDIGVSFLEMDETAESEISRYIKRSLEKLQE